MFALTNRAKGLLVTFLVLVLSLLGAAMYQIKLEVQRLEAQKPAVMVMTKEVVVTPTVPATPSAMLKVVAPSVKAVVPVK